MRLPASSAPSSLLSLMLMLMAWPRCNMSLLAAGSRKESDSAEEADGQAHGTGAGAQADGKTRR